MKPARPSIFCRAHRLAVPLAALAGLSSAGCYFSDEGLNPPPRTFYFPTGLAVSPGRSALYVVNSDFDLQYNGGTVNVVDLAATRATLGRLLARDRCHLQAEDACAEIGVAAGSEPTLEEVCNGFPFRESGAANGAACEVASDCKSGACIDELCAACTTDADCAPAANARCGAGALAGVCVLAKNLNTTLSPTGCTSFAPNLAADGNSFASIGAFASGAVLAQDPAGSHVRLFVPVRGDPSITWFDVVDDREGSGDTLTSRLDCGQTGDTKRCADEHRMGMDPYDNPRTALLPVEPVGLDISDGGEAIVSAHQIADAPAVGLSLNDWSRVPTFQYYTTAGIPAGPMEVAHVPAPAITVCGEAELGAGQAIGYEPSFLVTYNATPEVDLFRYNADSGARPPRPFITRAVSTAINTNADGKDSRGLAVDDSRRRACEAACGSTPSQRCAGDPACLAACLDVPLDVYIANRKPDSLIIGRVRTTLFKDGGTGLGSSVFDVPEIYDVVSMAPGASKVALGQVIGADGKLETRVFVVSFDSKRIYSYDPEARTVDLIIDTGRGPHALTFDTGVDEGGVLRSFLYVGHFTDSYLGVIDLDMRHRETYGIMFASIGIPVPPRESK